MRASLPASIAAVNIRCLAEAYFARGNAWLKKKDSPRALEDAKEALKLRPDVQKYDDFVYEVRSAIKKN